jgi:hypothetical protein
VQGPGNPTTWVFARERSASGVLAAIREGRTAVSLLPPTLGSARLMLEADGDGDGTFESIVGDTVPPGAPLRVRAVGVTMRANGATILDRAPLAPGGVVTLNAPAEVGWVRASLLLPDGAEERSPNCGPLNATTTYCRNHWVKAALTSPIYLAAPVVPVPTQLGLVASAQGESVSASALLTTADGAPLPGRTVAVTVRDQTVSAVTGPDGRATASFAVPDHGKSQVVDASFSGDPPYEPSSASTTARWGK